MGYDLNRFVEIPKLKSSLKCLICGLILKEPLQIPDCEHNFCNQCITIWLQTNHNCPHYSNEEDNISVRSDKKKSPLRKMSFKKMIGKSSKETSKDKQLKLSDLKPLPKSLLNDLNSLKVNCDFEFNGCKEKLDLGNLLNHVKSCEFKDLNSKANTSNITKTVTNVLEDCVKMVVDNQESSSKKQSDKEEEVGSDDFVVIPKTISSNDKTANFETTSLEQSDSNLAINEKNICETVTSGEKEKKKKKKKKNKKSNSETSSLTDNNLIISSGDSKTQSKESLSIENEHSCKQLKEVENKNENLRLINNQLLGQIKKLKEENEQFCKQIECNSFDSNEIVNYKNRIQELELENEVQKEKINNLINLIEKLELFTKNLKQDQVDLQAKYFSTLSTIGKLKENIRINIV